MIARWLFGQINPVHLIRLAFTLRPRSEFLLFHEERLTRRQVWANICALAAGLQALGIRQGERVAVLLPACPEAVYTTFMPSLLGNVNVPLNPLLREGELRHILADCGASAVITVQRWYGQDYPAMLARIVPDLPELRHVIVCRAGPAALDSRGRQVALEEVMARPCPRQKIRCSADDLVLISYTSGTTGRPKGVAHTRGQSLGLVVRAAGRQMNRSPLRCLLLPFAPYQFAGTFGLVGTLLAGGKVILLDHFDPQKMLELIQTERVTQIGASPTMFRLLLRTPGLERYDLSSLRRITLSTEPCPPELAYALHERLHCHLQNMYGTTESKLISWTGPDDPWERAATTVGRPVPGARVRIVDDQRQPLPAGQPGEIAVQTAQMMAGYYHDAQLTGQVLDAAGWFYTGDVGYVDEEGYLHLVDRQKDLIIRGGQNVYPAEVEACLERLPLVRRAAVVGVPSELVGEAIWAFLELYPGAALSATAALNFCRQEIALFKVPEQVRFLEHLPVTASGKVEKYRLRETALAEAGNH